MPLYECRKCHCVENTALGDYWGQQFNAHDNGVPFVPRCSECFSGKWHGNFEKTSAVGMLIDNRGFLWSQGEAATLSHALKIVGTVETPLQEQARMADLMCDALAKRHPKKEEKWRS